MDKSIFYHWKWQFLNGKMRCINIDETNPDISLKQIPIGEGSRTLGMKLDPLLSFQDTTTFIIDKIISFQTKIQGAPFISNDDTVEYRALFTPAVYYGVEAISLTGKQCK